MSVEQTKLVAGQFKIPVTLISEGGRIYFQFGFNRTLMNEVKAMEGSKWHGYDDHNPRKIWSVSDNLRNRFQLDYLKGNNPYAVYDAELLPYLPTRDVRTYQSIGIQHCLTRHYCLLAAEMGTGKTLDAIEVMEASGFIDWWYVAPKSALRAVEREFNKWNSRVVPECMTYEALVRRIDQWPPGAKAPRGVFFDEITRAKNPTAKRSQAAKQLADGIRSDWGAKGFVIGMSGSPAPKNPGDWWHLCEIVCPGFLREGTRKKFEQRLGLIVDRESITGGVYPHLVTWLDNEAKCTKCGELAESPKHSPSGVVFEVSGTTYHQFVPSKNEVAALYGRMKGLVLVQLKKDCLKELPDKIYRTVECNPSTSILRAAKIIVKKSPTVVSGMILLRELSDGFQYIETEQGTEQCPRCFGKKQIEDFTIKPGVVVPDGGCDSANYPELYERKVVDCETCGGTGEVKKFIRETKQVPCPKEEALIDLLDEYEDIGRAVVYAGFTGSVDRCKVICQKQGWHVIRVDGRGWIFESATCAPISVDPLTAFQDMQEQYEKIVFVGQAGAAGMGLTLTASPVIIYYSNDFDAEHRIQSEDRIHRLGMDLNKGATIIDLIHLPTDLKVLNNLKEKRRLQDMTMGQFAEALDQYSERIGP